MVASMKVLKSKLQIAFSSRLMWNGHGGGGGGGGGRAQLDKKRPIV